MHLILTFLPQIRWIREILLLRSIRNQNVTLGSKYPLFECRFLIHPIVEEYRLGYARLAAFLNIDPSFTVIRRFDHLHLRLLLEKQAHLSELERQLMKCDDEETVQLYASSCKQDENVERRRLIEEIQVNIHNYGIY